MANSLLTPTEITREALRVLHQKLNFIGSVHRGYDNRYAKTGAKIGNDLSIRLPNEFTVRSGATLDLQDVSESSVTLSVATQKGVDFSFTSEERTMHLDDFSKRYLDPAMSVLAARMESDALGMYKQVANFVDGEGAAHSMANVLNANAKLTNALAPYTDRTMIMGTQGHTDLVTAVAGVFNDSAAISKNYREGRIGGPVGGFQTYYENTLVPTHTTGTAAEGDTSYDVDGASQTGSTLVVDGGSTTFLEGDIITIAGCNAVHPETKVSTGALKQFVVTADSGASATSLSISPAITVTGGKQNVSASPTDNGIVTKVGGGNGAAWQEVIGFHKDAFAFATADLVKPEGVDFCAREVMDGLSMRIVRNYDIVNDKFPCRLDVMYGFKAIRPELACRIGIN